MNIFEALKKCNKYYSKSTLIRPNRNKLFTILVIDGAIYNSEFHFSIEDILANDWELVED